jgi:SAM-dependent methyltransferase
MFSPNLYSRLAKYYDDLHSRREYPEEVAFVKEIFRKFSESATERTLDLFCGTGGHSIPAARLGFDVVGLDASQDMLSIARRKVRSDELSVRFEMGDCRALPFASEFDLVFGFGQSLQYLVSYDEIRDSFRGIHRALRPGGICIFDIIDGWRMLQPFESRDFDITRDGTRILRLARTELDRYRRIALSRVTWVINTPDNHMDLDETIEEYRIFFVDELVFLLQISGFEVLGVYGDYRVDTSSDDDCLARTFVARALASGE